MIHVRVVSPARSTRALLAHLQRDPAVVHLAELGSAATSNPQGDLLQFDVLNGGANGVLDVLEAHGVVDEGAVAVEDVVLARSTASSDAAARMPRFSELTPIWELVDARVRGLGRYPPSWFGLLTIAGVIGAVGILTNSQILIVAAMVVGPEYSAIIAVARGATLRDQTMVARGTRALFVGFAMAVVVAGAFAAAIRASGRTPHAFAIGIRPVSHLINTPDLFSVVVAVLAGIVGVIAITESKASTLIGVFVSVTTIPAAADVGVSISYGAWREALGSLFQLLLNVAILVGVGALGFVIQRRLWSRVRESAGG